MVELVQLLFELEKWYVAVPLYALIEMAANAILLQLEMERKKIELRNAFPESPQTPNDPTTARPTGASASAPRDRDRDLRAAAVAVPRNNARSSPQPNAPAGGQRKGG